MDPLELIFALIIVFCVFMAYMMAVHKRISVYGDAMNRLINEDFETYLKHKEQLRKEWDRYNYRIWRPLPDVLQKKEDRS